MKEQGEFRMRNEKTGDSRRDPSTSLGVTASEPAKKILEWRPGVALRAMPGQAERKNILEWRQGRRARYNTGNMSCEGGRLCSDA